MSCQHCIFSHASQSESGVFYLRCLRFPPTPVYHQHNGEMVYVSPKVEPDATCGEEKHYD